MTTSISLPQHTLEGMYAAKVSIASDQQVNAETMPLQGMDLSTVLPYEDDPYTFSRQMLAQNSHLLPSPVPESSSPGGFHSAFTDTPLDWQEVQGASRQLQRDFNLSDDDYMAMGRRASRPDNSEEKTTSASVMGSPPHIAALETLIGSIHTDYQQTYAKINEKAAEFMKDVNTAVGKISDFIKAGSDGKIKLHAYNYLDEMRAVLEKYTGFKTASDNPHFINWANSNSPSLPIYTFYGDENAGDFWKKKLGNGFEVKRVNSGLIEISPSLEPIKNIYKSIIENATNNSDKGYAWGNVNMSSQAFQSLQSAIDSQKNAVNSGISQLLERFRQDNSTFETLIQLLQQMTQDLHRYNAGYFQ